MPGFLRSFTTHSKHKGKGMRQEHPDRSEEGIELAEAPLAAFLSTSTERFAMAVFGLPANGVGSWPGLMTYIDHLQDRFSEVGTDWIQPLEGITSFGECLELISDMCEIIVNSGPSRDLCIDDIVQAWHDNQPNDMHPTNPAAVRDTCRRAVFCILVWVILLADVPSSPPNNHFQVTFPDQDITDTLNTQRLDSARRPLHALFRGFCYSRLLPSLNPPPILNASADNGLMQNVDHDLLYVSCLNCSILSEFSKITIEWTNLITYHLTFISATRTLYLFRLPTFCALGCIDPEDDTGPAFDRIMHNYFNKSDQTTKVWLRFRQEILLSYRILFGQDKASRRYFQKIKSQVPGGAKLLADPLLETLCGKKTRSPEMRALPGNLWPRPCRNLDNTLRKQDEYSISTDLPLLGPRLLVVQEFNLRQRPKSFWGLWRDTRDKAKWYTFWVVLIVGGFTIILAVVQIALSAAQLAVSLPRPTERT